MELYQDLTFPTLPDRPYTICNMVMTADGKATMSGASRGIGDATDHLVMEQLRTFVDATLSGSGTLTKEDITSFIDEPFQQQRVANNKPPLPRAMTITGQPTLPTDKHFFEPKYLPTVFYTGEPEPNFPPICEVVRINADNSLIELTRAAKSHLDINLLLLEGGPRLNHEMMAAGLVDELFVTVAPKLEGLSGPSIVEGASSLGIDLELLSVGRVGSEMFLRYKLVRN